MIFGWAHALLAFVVVQRLAELVYARRNTAALMARGARETGAAHYPLFILLHGAWLVVMFALTEPNPPVRWVLLAIFAALQLSRVWILSVLGPYWTTRIITLRGARPVAAGPYRYVRHPNYLLVAFEVPVLPLALSLPWVALVFGVLNLALLGYRISVEDDARRHIAA